MSECLDHIMLFYSLKLAVQYKKDQNRPVFELILNQISEFHNLRMEVVLMMFVLFEYPDLADAYPIPNVNIFRS